MAEDLYDARIKMTVLTAKWVAAEVAATGTKQPEILREALHMYAQSKINEFNLRHKSYTAKGLLGDNWGIREGKE